MSFVDVCNLTVQMSETRSVCGNFLLRWIGLFHALTLDCSPSVLSEMVQSFMWAWACYICEQFYPIWNWQVQMSSLLSKCVQLIEMASLLCRSAWKFSLALEWRPNTENVFSLLLDLQGGFVGQNLHTKTSSPVTCNEFINAPCFQHPCHFEHKASTQSNRKWCSQGWSFKVVSSKRQKEKRLSLREEALNWRSAEMKCRLFVPDPRVLIGPSGREESCHCAPVCRTCWVIVSHIDLTGSWSKKANASLGAWQKRGSIFF